MQRLIARFAWWNQFDQTNQYVLTASEELNEVWWKVWKTDERELFVHARHVASWCLWMHIHIFHSLAPSLWQLNVKSYLLLADLIPHWWDSITLSNVQYSAHRISAVTQTDFRTYYMLKCYPSYLGYLGLLTEKCLIIQRDQSNGDLTVCCWCTCIRVRTA